ncbi:mechanosensitive ion channel family protein [Micromonospora endophytica]|uniref:Mechanosensitive ion channel protein MscS n=1 Tax=Micromonospora endophytica TaxID=515350 RepID=A0A2W2C7X5_9ACTN|nr:mechanosensitive ion channel domain-containing protein [Micromonospora endophytica]PZF93850.1 mechanosensitive ion channel protein MscS [Micromonospora endophytica]RIW42657.1 mechanosensitive ion channel family protein [Micromonospora endophytica]
MPSPVPVTPSPGPTETPDVPSPECLTESLSLCEWAWDLTGSVWFAEGSYWILIKPLRIILILLLAIAARWLVHRTIRRLVRTTSDAGVPTMLRPLRERIPSATADPGEFVPERRRQRAEAIGSVLRSLSTAFIYGIALLMVLKEFSFDLAPLLASAGIAGVALGFGAQSLVKDLIAGLFMLIEDQYGVGDTVDLGEATGVVEAVGLRVTTVRDGRGVLWYIRNGEVVRVGNKSQGWALAVVDLPIGFAGTEEATAVLRTAAASIAVDPELAPSVVEPPQVLGVEQVTMEGTIIRTVVKTTAEGQPAVARELRRRLAEALENSGITARIAAVRGFPGAPSSEGPGTSPGPRP